MNGSKWQYGTLGFYATEVLLWLAIFSFLFLYCKKIFVERKEKIKFSWSKDRVFILSVLVFLVYCFASVFWSLDTAVALQQSFHIMEAFLLFFVLYLGLVDWKRAAQWFVAGAVLQSAFGIYQFLTQSTFAFKWLGLVVHPVMEAGTSVIVGDGIGRVLRAYGAFSHPNVFGGYLAITIFVTLYLLFQDKKNKVLFGALFLQLIALFFTFSRSAWLAVGVVLVGLCVYFIKTKKWNYTKIILSCFVFGAVLSALYFPLVHTRVAHQSSHEIRSTEERVGGIKEGIQIWKTAPMLGVGVGNYTAASYKQNPTRPGYEYQPVHNVPLLVLSEFGVLGGGLLLLIVVTFFRLLPKDKKAFFFASIFIFGLLSIFDHYLYSSYIGILVSGIYFVFTCSVDRRIDKMSSKE